MLPVKQSGLSPTKGYDGLHSDIRIVSIWATTITMETVALKEDCSGEDGRVYKERRDSAKEVSMSFQTSSLNVLGRGRREDLEGSHTTFQCLLDQCTPLFSVVRRAVT